MHFPLPKCGSLSLFIWCINRSKIFFCCTKTGINIWKQKFSHDSLTCVFMDLEWKRCVQSFSNWSPCQFFQYSRKTTEQKRERKTHGHWPPPVTIMSHCRCYGDYSLKETQQKARPWPIPLWCDFMPAWVYSPPNYSRPPCIAPQAALKAVSQAEKNRMWWDVQTRYASFLCNLVRVLDHHLPFSPSPPQSDSPWVATCPITIQPTRQTPSYSWHFVLSLFTTGPSGKSVRRP